MIRTAPTQRNTTQARRASTCRHVIASSTYARTSRSFTLAAIAVSEPQRASFTGLGRGLRAPSLFDLVRVLEKRFAVDGGSEHLPVPPEQGLVVYLRLLKGLVGSIRYGQAALIRQLLNLCHREG